MKLNQMPSVMLLAHFGDLITKLKVDYSQSHSLVNYDLEDAISKYCRENVAEIEFRDSKDFAFIGIERPFESVNKVLFTACRMGSLI